MKFSAESRVVCRERIEGQLQEVQHMEDDVRVCIVGLQAYLRRPTIRRRTLATEIRKLQRNDSEPIEQQRLVLGSTGACGCSIFRSLIECERRHEERKASKDDERAGGMGRDESLMDITYQNSDVDSSKRRVHDEFWEENGTARTMGG